MEAAFHYVVKAKVIKHREDRELDFVEIKETFKDEDPIVARDRAFRFYQNWIDILLQHKGKEYVTDKQARRDLTSFIEPGGLAQLKAGSQQIEFSDKSFGNGIGVYFVKSKPVDMGLSFLEVGQEGLIHGIGNLSDQYMLDDIMIYLNEEAECYRYLNYDTNNKEIEITFCGQAPWLDGCGETAIATHTVLETPFDWKGYETPYWWGESEERAMVPVPKTLEEIILLGESNSVEFKSSLHYNLETKVADRVIKEMIAKTICAFLNSRGGVLIVGVNDDGSINGLDHDYSLATDKNPKDYFKLVFDDLLELHLGIARISNITSQFYELQGKEIFAVEVSPGTRPFFLKKKEEKYFYVRLLASTRQIKDAEEIIQYWIDRSLT